MSARSFCLFFVVGLILVLPGAGRAETFYAYLTPAQEVPPAASTASGYARVVINESTGVLTFTVVFSGLSSNQTASHIHAPAAIGANTGVAINFGAVGGTSGTITGSTTVTPTQLAQIRQHLGYVNVHTSTFPGGEIRGQLGIKRPIEFDGDGRNDYSVLRFPAAGDPRPITFWNLNSTSGVFSAFHPNSNALTDFPAPGDYEGDGKDDLALFRTPTTVGSQAEFWIVLSSNFTIRYFAWGLTGDQAVSRDYDGDGITDVAVFRKGASTGIQTNWYIRQSSDGTARVVGFGTTGDTAGNFGDTPVPGDYDGDGKFDIAVYRFGGISPNNNYIVLRSSDSAITYTNFGNFTTDWILPGDYDGDGKYDMAVARTGATGTAPMIWWILQSSNGQVRTQVFGISSDFPTQGDYDGDARTDISIYRRGATTGAASFFWVFNSFTNTASVTQWGVREDFATNRFDSR